MWFEIEVIGRDNLVWDIFVFSFCCLFVCCVLYVNIWIPLLTEAEGKGFCIIISIYGLHHDLNGSLRRITGVLLQGPDYFPVRGVNRYSS